ncbi:Hydroxysqualene synthase [Commensalibacter sp. Nvir]|uniref:squalene synthase HpnC n=1 Tax=Commensalibacter sp. Nvir TaxID=3069817 RepID=UPI002D5058E3|nr:Hydroxysqualene synthase [Commensalibacter sp. Nvir]
MTVLETSFLYDASIWGMQDVSSGKKAKDENFPVGSLVIKRKFRPHVKAYYNFARVIDDIADSNVLSAEQKIKRLKGMEAVLCHDEPAPDRSDILTARYLRNTLIEMNIPFNTATDLLIAFRQDAVKNRYSSFEELATYCQYSANPVGHFLLTLHQEEHQAIHASNALCTALQILNHLQDCKNDLIELDRCYIPLDMLENKEIHVQALRKSTTSPLLRKVFDKLLDYVDVFNHEAEYLPKLIKDRRLKLESAIIVFLSQKLAKNLREQDPLSARVKLGKKDIASSILKAFAQFF